MLCLLQNDEPTFSSKWRTVSSYGLNIHSPSKHDENLYARLVIIIQCSYVNILLQLVVIVILSRHLSQFLLSSRQSWSYGSWIYRLPVLSVPITTNVASSNPAHGEVYSIQHYVIKFVSGRSVVFSGYCDVRHFTSSLVSLCLIFISSDNKFLEIDKKNNCFC